MSVKLVVYDLDGTLIDSAPATIYVLNQLRQELGRAPLPNSAFVPWLSLGGTSLISNSLEFEAKGTAEIYLQEFRKRLRKLELGHIPLYKNVDQTLSLLYNSNIKLSICTSKVRDLTDKILHELNISSYFSYIVAGGDLPTTKPDPRNLLACCDNLNISKQDTIFVGDSTVDRATAKNADVKFALFEGGYNDGVDTTGITTFSDHLELANKVLNG